MTGYCCEKDSQGYRCDCPKPTGGDSSSKAGSTAIWRIGEIHPLYGEVQMMGSLGGEAYRWFSKNNVVSMIPLSILRGQCDD